MIDPEDPNSGEDDENLTRTNVIAFRLPGVPQPDFTVPDAPINGGSTLPDAPVTHVSMDPKYAAILESQGWSILSPEDIWDGSSTQQFVAINVSRIVDSGEIPIPDVEVGDKRFSIVDDKNNFNFKPVVAEIVEKLLVEESPFVNIRIPGLSLLTIGNRMKRGGYNIEDFFEELISLICQVLCDKCGFDITADIGTGNLVGDSNGVVLFHDYYDAFIRINGNPPVRLVE